MEIKTCKFVEVSDVFAKHGLAWDVFVNSNPNCSWGDNNRSLVTPDVIIDALEDASCDGVVRKQVNAVVERLKSLGQTYIDLEN